MDTRPLATGRGCPPPSSRACRRRPWCIRASRGSCRRRLGTWSCWAGRTCSQTAGGEPPDAAVLHERDDLPGEVEVFLGRQVTHVRTFLAVNPLFEFAGLPRLPAALVPRE